MNKKQRTVVLVYSTIAIFLLINFVGKSLLHKRTVKNMVVSILKSWENNNPSSTFKYWEDADSSPPVASLSSYEINKKKFYSEKRRRHAQFLTTLHFPSNNLFPSGQQWVFTAKLTKVGWLIIKFEPYSPDTHSF